MRNYKKGIGKSLKRIYFNGENMKCIKTEYVKFISVQNPDGTPKINVATPYKEVEGVAEVYSNQYYEYIYNAEMSCSRKKNHNGLPFSSILHHTQGK